MTKNPLFPRGDVLGVNFPCEDLDDDRGLRLRPLELRLELDLLLELRDELDRDDFDFDLLRPRSFCC